MISFEEHAKRLGLDNEERELLADFEKNAGKRCSCERWNGSLGTVWF